MLFGCDDGESGRRGERDLDNVRIGDGDKTGRRGERDLDDVRIGACGFRLSS